MLVIAVAGGITGTCKADKNQPLFSHIVGVQQPHALEPDQVNRDLHGTSPSQLWAAAHTVNDLGGDIIKIALEARQRLSAGEGFLWQANSPLLGP
jgi:hypothetical protein